MKMCLPYFGLSRVVALVIGLGILVTALHLTQCDQGYGQGYVEDANYLGTMPAAQGKRHSSMYVVRLSRESKCSQPMPRHMTLTTRGLQLDLGETIVGGVAVEIYLA